MIDAKRHVPLLDAFIAWAARMLEANEAAIREMVHARTGWLLRLAGLDDTIADKIVEGMAKLFEEMATDPGHPVRARAEQMRPCTVPGGWASMASNAEPPPRPTAPPRPRSEEHTSELPSLMRISYAVF